MKYIALLRGINVSGKKVPMKDLVVCFEQLDYANIKTILNTGNVVFESSKSSTLDLVTEIESKIKTKFGFEVLVQVRRFEELKKMFDENPFKNLTHNLDTHWYVTFLNQPPPKTLFPTDDSYKFLSISHNALFTTLDRTKAKTTDFMSFLDKNFGRSVTTRNWNTIEKILRN